MIKLIAISGIVFAPMFASAYFDEFGRAGYGMMGYGGGMSFFMVAGGIVWTIVGILASVWLWREINKKNGGH